MSDETGGLDLSHVTEIPGGDALQGALNNFNKKAAGAGFKFFKRILGTLTEPFFRIGMGERYYTPETHVWGIGFWVVATLIAGIFPYFSMLAWPLCELVGFHLVAPIFKYRIPVLVAGGFMIYTQWRSGRQGFRLVAQYRNEGNPYHTRSRGVPLHGGNEILAFVGLELVLLLFNLPCAVLFLFGYMMNAKIKAEQDAAIMSRYLDTLDAEVENQYLESAALGTTPTEITYLHKPLPKEMSPQMRNGVAASMVGKPVMGIGKRRQPAGAPQSGTPPTASATAPAANYLPTTSSAKTASSAPARVATPAASPARPAKSSRQDSPQSRTTATQTQTSRPGGAVFAPNILAGLRELCPPDLIARFVELKATRPDFPSDEEFLRRLGSCYQIGFESETDIEAMAERVLAVKAPQPQTVAKRVVVTEAPPPSGAELTQEEVERLEELFRRDIAFKFSELRSTRRDLPSREVFQLKLGSCSMDELKRLKNMDEIIELVLSKN